MYSNVELTDTELLLKLAQLMEPKKKFIASQSGGVFYKLEHNAKCATWFPWYITDDAAAFQLMCEYKICVEYLRDPDAVIVSGFNIEVLYNSVEERRYATRRAVVLAVIKLLTKANNLKLRLEKKSV